ncbi:MAG: hypothetical protein P4L84_33640 [Isosphaeraceae bacterium]|nr:hypothetical protein [Isosphaeraceae bacterium]
MSSAGPNNAGTCVDDSSIGTYTWSNPGNATGNTAYATVTEVGFGGITHYLKATNFGFSIPAGATINGIAASIYAVNTINGAINENSVKLVKAGSAQGSNLATSGHTYIFTPATFSWGGSTNLWGSSWSASDINDPGFGIALSYVGETKTSCTTEVRNIQLTVYYTAAAVVSSQAFVGRAGFVPMRSPRGPFLFRSLFHALAIPGPALAIPGRRLPRRAAGVTTQATSSANATTRPRPIRSNVPSGPARLVRQWLVTAASSPANRVVRPPPIVAVRPQLRRPRPSKTWVRFVRFAAGIVGPVIGSRVLGCAFIGRMRKLQ